MNLTVIRSQQRSIWSCLVQTVSGATEVQTMIVLNPYMLCQWIFRRLYIVEVITLKLVQTTVSSLITFFSRSGNKALSSSNFINRFCIVFSIVRTDFKFISKVESQTNNWKNQFLLILHDFFLQNPIGSLVYMPNYSGKKTLLKRCNLKTLQSQISVFFYYMHILWSKSWIGIKCIFHECWEKKLKKHFA